MKMQSVTVGAAGDSGWIAPNPWLINPVGVGLALTFSVDANLTASVQYTYDDLTQTPRAIAYARAGTVLTITDPSHGLNVGDNVAITQDTNFNGSWDVVTVPTNGTYTVTVPNAGPVNGNAQLQSFRMFKHPTMGNQTSAAGRIDGNLPWQVGGIRLQVSAYVAGQVTLTGQQPKGF